MFARCYNAYTFSWARLAPLLVRAQTRKQTKTLTSKDNDYPQDYL